LSLLRKSSLSFHTSKQMMSLITGKLHILSNHETCENILPLQKSTIQQMYTVGHTKQSLWAVTIKCKITGNS